MELVKYPTSLDPTDQPFMAVPLSNDSMNRPYPPRRTVLLLLKTRQAKPMRGAKSFLEEKRKFSGTPAWAAVMSGVGAMDCTKPGLILAKAAWLGKITAPVFTPLTTFW